MMIPDAVDIVVVGSGIAGLAAALAAEECGLKSVLIEKASKLGGTTADSYGLIWVGSNHLLQEAGETDARQDVIDYMTFLGGGELWSERMLTFVDRSPAALRFFASCGVGFQLSGGIVDHYYGVAKGARLAGRTLEATLISGHTLGSWREKVRTPAAAPYYITAQEQISWGGINRASSWDRALVEERQRDDLRGKGVGLVTHFVKELLSRHVPILLDTPVDSLLENHERISGVRLMDGREIIARKGVVVATGGYEWNADLMQDFESIPRLQPQSPPSLTGDGFVFATEIGAAVRRIQNNLNLMLAFTLDPDTPGGAPIQCMAGIVELCSPHTMVVNAAGDRFGDESYFQSLVPALRQFDTMKHAYINLPCYLIFDQQYASAYTFGHLPAGSPIPRSVTRADSLPELAARLGVDVNGLARTAARFNGFAASGRDEDFRRGDLKWGLANRSHVTSANRSLGALSVPPFYGVELHPTLGTSSAGLLTDRNGQVMHQRRRPIPGLYASGVVAARTELGAGYQAGLNLASAMTFSYLAVQHMMNDVLPR